MKLTDTACKNTKPKDKAYKRFDGGGLYLEIMPNGNKLWRLKYYYLGKEKRFSLGAYLPQRTQMMQHWSDYLDTVASKGKVIPGNFKKKAKAA